MALSPTCPALIAEGFRLSFGFLSGLLVCPIAPAQSLTAVRVALPCSFCDIKVTSSSSVLSCLGSPSMSAKISGSYMPLIRLSFIISLLKLNVWLQPAYVHFTTNLHRDACSLKLAKKVLIPIPGACVILAIFILCTSMLSSLTESLLISARRSDSNIVSMSLRTSLMMSWRRSLLQQ